MAVFLISVSAMFICFTGFMILYPLVVSAYLLYLTFAIFVLVVYSLFPMVTEIKSFYLILLTRWKLQDLLLWTWIVKLR